jgi:hypothetical protein
VSDGAGCTHDCAFTHTPFWQQWTIAYGGMAGGGGSEGVGWAGRVAWGALPNCMGLWIMGACVTTLDNMLKLTSSEAALGVDFDYNHEMTVGGLATIASAVLVGAPAYGQTKFNVMNLSIAGTAKSAWPTIGLGALAFGVFFTGIDGLLINVIPRFLLGGLGGSMTVTR